MNNLRYIAPTLSLFAFVVLLSCGTQKQAIGEKEDTAALMESGHYRFEAQRFTTQSGFSRALTTAYDLSISKDTLKAWLPYFGRAYQAPMDPSKGGIDFTSTDFAYSIHKNGEKGWDVKITPNDHREVTSMTLSVSTSGYATLNVVSLNRQPISFYGKIAAAD